LKFVLIKYLGNNITQVERIIPTVHGGEVQKVLQQFAISIDANVVGEIALKNVMEHAKRAVDDTCSKN
jgi:hypothetical protein